MATEKTLVTAVELARELSLRPKTIMDLARAGKIPRIKLSGRIVRFDREAVITALKALAEKKN
jgi:excisionase family DNA binding protein